MSDGNFNRSLLPTNGYAGGIRAGRAQMKTCAICAFHDWLTMHHPELSESQRTEAELQFRQLLPQ